MTDKCYQCGICCTIFNINLSEQEYRSDKYKTEFEEYGLIDDFSEAKSCGANIVKQKKDGTCIYLVKRICSIHLNRPLVCRNFFCDSKKEEFQSMILAIEKVKCAMRET